ncbi:helix-turn-helix transcriptional regulator [Agromyces italicus]|uniref:helix-turn-helix transcriptional regulator n=1 Tax=Agromyces italicus TaxID=279572 RepID=UPI000428615D|nr:helix-turn-helix transcriptional regulator [Agromyces italicus]
MASTPERPRQAPRHRSSTEVFEDTRAVVELLARHRLVVAPHVAARLGLALSGDADAIIEVTGRLRAAQRLGHAVLPDPLPLVPAIEAAVGAEVQRLAEWERTLLVTAAVCVDDRVDVLLAASGRPMSALVAGEVSRHLLLVAGHFAFADPRTRVWVHAVASLADRTGAHATLARAYTELGDDGRATWHRSLSTLEGSEALVAPLLELAEAADAAGEPEWAHAVAREAASHASGRAEIDAWRVAGRSALHGGHVDDARCWLGAVLEHGDEDERASVLADYLIVRAALEGDVPLGELDDRLAATGDDAVDASDAWGSLARRRSDLARASATAAGLLAERGAPAAASRRLADAARMTARHGLDDAPLLAAAAWCAMFGVGSALDGVASSEGAEGGVVNGAPNGSATPGACAIALAIEQGLAGHPERAARWLDALRDTSSDPRLAGDERAPLMRAARAVAAALLVLWSGEVGRAGRLLARAATDLPIALPFGGLGATLARRIDIITTGEIGAFALAVEAAQPPSRVSIRAEELVDRAVAAQLRGANTEAATLVALAAEREQTVGCGLHVPGLDSVAGWEGGPSAPSPGGAPVPEAGVRRPLDARLAGELHRRMRSTDRHRFEVDYRAALETSRAIGSHYERARTELMLARACGEAGAFDRAQRHLLTAEHLFDESGARAWLAVIDGERRVLSAAVASSAAPAGERAMIGAGGDPASGRAAARVTAPSADGTARAAVAPVASAAAASDPTLAEPADVDDPLVMCRAVWADVLTERELEVAMLVVGGASNRDAAARLYVSVRTVEVHLGRVFTKLDVHSRVELAVLAYRMRGLSPSRTT